MWMSCELTTPKLDHARQDKIIRTKNRLREGSGFMRAYGVACLFFLQPVPEGGGRGVHRGEDVVRRVSVMELRTWITEKSSC